MKVSIIGAGQVGAMLAARIVEADLADVTLVDILKGMPQAKALDLLQAAPIVGHNRKVVGTNDFSEIGGSGLVIVTAGLPRSPGMAREDLISKNAKILEDVVGKIAKHSPGCIILMVTNPLDAMTYLAYKLSGFEPHRVFGMGGLLDSARFSFFLSQELKMAVGDISAIVLGGHGETMVPLPRFTKARGESITTLLTKEKIDYLIERTRQAGGEIVAGLGTGSAYFAPSASVYAMAKSVILDEKKTFPASVLLQGQYGLTDICIGVPAKVGKDGIEEVVILKLNRTELDALHRSAEIIRGAIKRVVTSNQ